MVNCGGWGWVITRARCSPIEHFICLSKPRLLKSCAIARTLIWVGAPPYVTIFGLAFSFDLLKNFPLATFSLINQLPRTLYNFWSNDAYEWVSGRLTCGLDATLQLSKIRGAANSHYSSSSIVCWWFIGFCKCLWLKIWCCYCCYGPPGSS